jgi:predicted Rossmann fold nucleotide-binding protein DprA/Smf involved in DNA uptake
LEYLGNQALLKLPKVAFLCSQKVPATAVLKCYDWAIAQRDAGNCVISGFHSQIEKDVFHFLAKGEQPIIMVLARGMKSKFDSVLQKILDKDRLLIVSPFDQKVTRLTKETANERNKVMIEMADQVVVGHCQQEGSIWQLTKDKQSIKFL